MRPITTILTLTAVASLAASGSVDAQCSYANFKDLKGNEWVVRANELPMETDELFIVVPRGHQMRDSKAKYGYVGIRHGDTEMVSSGINEHGLSYEALGYWSAEYADAPKDQADATSLSIGYKLLGEAKSVDEAVEMLKAWTVIYEDMKQFGAARVPFHYALNDGKRAVVVEIEDGGKPKIYENTMGVMTNDPSYPLIMAKAESAIAAVNARSRDTKDIFPGFDSSSESRFARLAAMNAAYKVNRKANDARDEGINRAISLLNSIEIVAGSMYWEFIDPKPQITAYGNIVDVTNKVYYFRTYDNHNMRRLDLKNIDFGEAKYSQTPIYGMKPTFFDATDNAPIEEKEN